MTCIVGVQAEGKVVLGGDSALVGEYDVDVLGRPKVYRVGPYIVGAAGSARMSNLLNYKFKPTPPPLGTNIMGHMVNKFVEELRVLLRDGGVSVHTDNGEMFPGSLLVGFGEHLFVIHGDYQVSPMASSYAVIGVSAEIAKGSLEATEGVGLDPKDRALRALETSAKFNGGVTGPFHFVTT